MDQYTPENPSLPAQEVAAISGHVLEHKENPENKELGGFEVVKKSLESYTAPVVAQAKNDAPMDPNLPSYVAPEPAAVKQEIEHLLSLVFQKGILSATAEAAHSNPFILDAFHDALAGKLYPELQKRGIVD